MVLLYCKIHTNREAVSPTDFKQLNYIVTIAKEQNITHAAEKLYITRSALNYSLLNLEKELGVQLFKRLPNKLIPTYAGELYLEKAQQILNQHHELDHIMSGLADSSLGRINLGITVAGGQRNLMDIFPAFHQKYPGFSLKLVEGNVKFLEKNLLDGTIDLAWSGSDTTDPLLDHIITRPRSSLNLALSRDNPLVLQYHLLEKAGDYIDLSLFKDEMFITMNKETFVRAIIDSYFHYAGFHPNILMQCSRLDMMAHFVAHTSALGFLPEDRCPSSLLCFKLKPDLEISQTIFFRRGQIFTEAEKYLIHLFLENQNLSDFRNF